MCASQHISNNHGNGKFNGSLEFILCILFKISYRIILIENTHNNKFSNILSIFRPSEVTYRTTQNAASNARSVDIVKKWSELSISCIEVTSENLINANKLSVCCNHLAEDLIICTPYDLALYCKTLNILVNLFSQGHNPWVIHESLFSRFPYLVS